MKATEIRNLSGEQARAQWPRYEDWLHALYDETGGEYEETCVDCGKILQVWTKTMWDHHHIDFGEYIKGPLPQPLCSKHVPRLP